MTLLLAESIWACEKRLKALWRDGQTMIIIVCHIMAQLKHGPLSSFSLMHTPWIWFLRCGSFFPFRFNVVLFICRNWLLLFLSFLFSEPSAWRNTRTDDHNLWLTSISSRYGHCYHSAELFYSHSLLHSVLSSSFLCASARLCGGNCGNIGSCIVRFLKMV